MDRISICGIQCRGLHGLYENERELGNDFEVDIHAELLNEIPHDPNLDKLFDYEKAVLVTEMVIKGTSKHLIEELALEIGDSLWEKNLKYLNSLQVRVRKLNPPTLLKAQYSQVCLNWPRYISH